MPRDDLINAIDSPTVAALQNVFNGPFKGESYSKQIADILAPRLVQPAQCWKCQAPAKAACAWPDCGCDPEATKVIAALVDQGWKAPPECRIPAGKERLSSAVASTYWICCNCDAPLSCAACGVEQPDDSAHYEKLQRERDQALAQVESAAARDVLAERKRQMEKEGWTLEHDDSHISAEMAMAAAVYALTSFLDTEHSRETAFTRYWPWDRSWFKPAGGRKDLVRAGALILAEIDRLDRLSHPSTVRGPDER